MRIGVLASGAGTILSSLIEAGLGIVVVLVDRHCAAEQVAASAKIPVVVLERKDFGTSFDREAYSASVADALAPYRCDLIAMAGFGTVLGRAFHAAFPARVLNTHPALLPAFKGWHAVADALAAGVKVTGCTVHVATIEVDAGPIIAQEAVPVLAGDSVETLHERIKAVERRLYPKAIAAFAATLGAEQAASEANQSQTGQKGTGS